MAPVALFVLLAVGLAAAFVPLLFGLVYLPSWDEMVELSSGRLSMWLEKIDTSPTVACSSGCSATARVRLIVSEVVVERQGFHNDFIRLLNQQGVLGLGAAGAGRVVAQFPPEGGAAAGCAGGLHGFSNGIMFRPQASLDHAALALVGGDGGPAPQNEVRCCR